MNCTQSGVRLKTLTGTGGNFENFVFPESLSVYIRLFGGEEEQDKLKAVAAWSVCFNNVVLTYENKCETPRKQVKRNSPNLIKEFFGQYIAYTTRWQKLD